MDIRGTKIVKISDKGYYHIPCAATGKMCLCGEERLEKLVKRYGSLQKVCENYVSRDGKRLLKSGMSKEKVRKISPEDAIELARMIKEEKLAKRAERQERKQRKKKVREERKSIFPTFVFNRDEVHIRPCDLNDEVTVKGLTEKMCLFPDIYLKNDRACNGCRLIKHCIAPCKRVRVGK